MYRKCGDVPDFARRYFTVHPNITDIENTGKCLLKLDDEFNQSKCDCPPACIEGKYRVRDELISYHN